jgi:site-specific recombinase XerD
MDNYQSYLTKTGLKHNTIKGYVGRVKLFVKWVKDNKKVIEKITYNDMLKYTAYLKQRSLTPQTINSDLLAIRLYYNMLNGKINPVQSIRVKGTIKTLPNNVLDEQQLIVLYDDFKIDQQSAVSHRDKVILGLIVFQGLKSADLQCLLTSDINLDQTTIFIKQNNRRNERTLKLDPRQMIDLYNYVKTVRKELLKQKGEESELLFFSTGTGNHISTVLKRLIAKVRKQNNNITSFEQVISSVYTVWLSKFNLREVQYMAGHRYVSSTERYKQADLKGLQEELSRFYPMS